MYFRMARTAVTVLGGAAALCLGSVPAALAAPADGTEFVPCNAYALHHAIEYAGYGETLNLAPGCTYRLPEELPDITTKLTIVGHHSTLTRTRHAGDFSLLTVGNCEGSDGPAIKASDGTVINASDVTVINVDFTGGGGYGIDDGGAIDNGGRLHVRGGVFSFNEADESGGAIYSDCDLTVSGATFTHNRAPYGGAILNDGDARIDGSAFIWNAAQPSPVSVVLTLSGDPGNSEGGAIYNEDHMYLADSGFLANRTDGYGGAVYTDDQLHARHITVTSNEADVDGGGIYNDDETAAVFDSVVFGNLPDNCHDVSGCH
jgi:predicted outer membrane repeat protein